MATYSFTAIQNAVAGLNFILFTDTSDYTGVTLSNRNIYLLLSNGNYLIEGGEVSTRTAINWSLSSSDPFKVNVLTKDYAIDIFVDYDISSSIETIESLQAFTGYAESFLYGLSQKQAANKNYIPSWFENKSILRTLVDMANECIDTGKDIGGAQNVLNAADYIINSPQSGYFF